MGEKKLTKYDEVPQNSNRKDHSAGSVNFDREVPPSLNYSIDWANDSDLILIHQALINGDRQTMNIRLMKSAKFLVLKDKMSENKIIGWQGFDFIFFPEYPEKFSLHLDEKYRSFALGLALEVSMIDYLQQNGISRLFSRMESASNKSLQDWRVKNGLYEAVDTNKENAAWVDLCHNCNLYGSKCTTQGFFKVNIENFVKLGIKRFGEIKNRSIPRELNLVEFKFRQDEEDVVKYHAKWAA